MKKRTNIRWGIVITALCVLCGMAWNRPRADQSHPKDVTLPEMEGMTVQIVRFGAETAGADAAAWEKRRIAAIVVDAGNNSVYPVGAELSLAFDLAFPPDRRYTWQTEEFASWIGMSWT